MANDSDRSGLAWGTPESKKLDPSVPSLDYLIEERRRHVKIEDPYDRRFPIKLSALHDLATSVTMTAGKVQTSVGGIACMIAKSRALVVVLLVCRCNCIQLTTTKTMSRSLINLWCRLRRGRGRPPVRMAFHGWCSRRRHVVVTPAKPAFRGTCSCWLTRRSSSCASRASCRFVFATKPSGL
jgi:hypothetical protein